jgi:rare lipoprotein A
VRGNPVVRHGVIVGGFAAPFHGRATARGESYGPEAFTAAHPSLPLASRVKVTNLANGRAGLLTVNDRGPFVDGRLIDLSRVAARRLGFKDAGLARVRAEALHGALR